MKIEIKNSDIINSLVPGLTELSTLKTSAKIASSIAKTVRVVNTAIEDFNSARKRIFESRCKKENGEPVIDNNEYVFESEAIKQEAIKLSDELLDCVVELEINQFSIEDLGTTEISANLIMLLGDMIKD